ncbi:hypothetical protein ACRAVF_05750 [Bradyrhizobium oligotrophicum S58]
MIVIDNSVELIIKTCLGLPKRLTGLSVSRKEYAEFSDYGITVTLHTNAGSTGVFALGDRR